MVDQVLDWLLFYQNELESASYLATLVGVPILLGSYLTSLIAESHRREVGTYDTLETQYVEFQKQAVTHARLDVTDKGLTDPPPLSEVEKAQQRTLYMILFSLFERAFLMYRTGLLGRLFMGRMRAQQWAGWISYMDKYFARESCRHAWFNGVPPQRDVGQDFDPRFEHFVWDRMKKSGYVR